MLTPGHQFWGHHSLQPKETPRPLKWHWESPEAKKGEASTVVWEGSLYPQTCRAPGWGWPGHWSREPARSPCPKEWGEAEVRVGHGALLAGLGVWDAGWADVAVALQ